MKDEPWIRRRERQKERRERDARRGRLGPGRFEALVVELVTVIRFAFEAGGIASRFGLEGPLRAAMRSDLCLQGWRWSEADTMAKDAMDEALRRLRAERPTWNEGQREWTIEAGTLIERTHCIRCHGPLPEGHHKFCSTLCANAHHQATHRRRTATEDQAMNMAISFTL
jgi:predicted nucleic acid-binding Zn ribbon protein